MPVGRTVLRVNLDGTAFCLHQGGGVGKISVTKRQCSGAPVESVPLSQRRCYMTHVAFICDHPDLPPHMPQVLVGNEATIPAETLEELNNALPAIVHLLRQRSAWNNAELLVEILKVLKSALVPFDLSGLQMMLLLDAASIRISWVVLRACFRAGICPCSLPAKKTWLLQPLDTHAIWPLKMCVCVRRLRERRRASSADGTATLREFLDCIATAIRQILQSHRWANAFDANGFGQNQSRLSHLVRRHLQLEGPVSISSSRPAEDQIRAASRGGAGLLQCCCAPSTLQFAAPRRSGWDLCGPLQWCRVSRLLRQRWRPRLQAWGHCIRCLRAFLGCFAFGDCCTGGCVRGRSVGGLRQATPRGAPLQVVEESNMV